MRNHCFRGIQINFLNENVDLFISFGRGILYFLFIVFNSCFFHMLQGCLHWKNNGFSAIISFTEAIFANFASLKQEAMMQK